MLAAGGSRLLPRLAYAVRRGASLPPLPLAAPLRSRAHASWPPAARSGGLAAWRAAVDARPDAVLWGLVAANCGVWVAWQAPGQQRFMRRHFMVHADAFSPARAHTLLTAAFSHRDAWHLGGNMLSLYFFGREIGRLFGGVRLAQLYVAGGLAASAAHVAWTRAEWRRAHPQTHALWGAPRGPPALGASGAQPRSSSAGA